MGLLFIWVRLFSLQVIGHERYKALSDENRLRLLKLPAMRGNILDRTGKILATSEKIFIDESGLKVEGYRRVYPEKGVAVHVIGSLGEVSGKESGLLTVNGKYQAGDLMGRSGLEGTFENTLRGKDGGWLLEVDHNGKMVRDMGKTSPVSGQAIKSTISLDLSKTAQDALGEKKGAVVVSDPRNGEVLVLVSSPGYDPNSLVENFENILADKNLPLFNRAISGTYPPGSVFKMVVTTAAIDSGKVKPGFTVDDHGFIQVGSYRYSNWLFSKRGGVEGVVGFSRAITRSTDTFFYKVGEILGPETMGEYAGKFGYGKKTGIDISGEEKGLIPSVAWKKEEKNENWYLGNSYHFAIGQDDLLVTPLQVNLMTNILATRGKKCIPHLVNKSPECEEVVISDIALDIVNKGMVGACSQGGTSFVFFDWNADKSRPQVACKTGTSEYVGENGKMKTHGWLTAFAPADNPEISVTVLMEGGGEGSNVAAPVVRKILAKYYNVADNYPYDRIPREVGE